MSISRTRSSKKGVTLIEVMVALTILGIGFAGLFSGFLHSRRLAIGSIYQNTAFTIANSYLEQLRSAEFITLDSNPINGLMSEGQNDSLDVSPTPSDVMVGNSATDIANTFTIDINNTPANETDDMTLRIFLYIDDLTNLGGGIENTRHIIIRYEADYLAAGYNQSFNNTIRVVRSEVPTF